MASVGQMVTYVPNNGMDETLLAVVTKETTKNDAENKETDFVTLFVFTTPPLTVEIPAMQPDEDYRKKHPVAGWILN